MKLLSSGGLALLAMGWVGLAACSDDDESEGNTGGTSARGGAGPTPQTECDVLGELCHPVGDDGGPLQECHELGHVNDPEVCHEQFPSCVSQCVEALEEAEGGEGGSGGAGEPGTAGAAPTEASPYCASLGELCHRVDDENGPLSECHDLGHASDPAVCEEEFESCAAQCLEAIEEQEAGEGGAGGAGGSGGQAPDETGGVAPLGGGGAGGEPVVQAGMGGAVEIGGSPGVAGDGGASPVDGGDGGMLGAGGDPGVAGSGIGGG